MAQQSFYSDGTGLCLIMVLSKVADGGLHFAISVASDGEVLYGNDYAGSTKEADQASEWYDNVAHEVKTQLLQFERAAADLASSEVALF